MTDSIREAMLPPDSRVRLNGRDITTSVFEVRHEYGEHFEGWEVDVFLTGEMRAMVDLWRKDLLGEIITYAFHFAPDDKHVGAARLAGIDKCWPAGGPRRGLPRVVLRVAA